jgi:YegS/Rv2252/BmrU family lipid kinase
LLVNRNARRGKEQISETLDQLKSLGLELQEESTEDPEQLSEIIRRHRDQVDLVIIGGGDGTLNAAIEGLVDTQLPLGILPLGTANDLARTLGIPQNLSQACQVIATGEVRGIDLGWVNGKYFFNVASFGLSVQITKRLTKEAKRRWGVFAYLATSLQVIWQARPFHAEIRIGDQSVQVKTVQIAVGNGRYYGGGMAVAKDATIDDQNLDLYSLEIQSWWQILLVLPALWRGQQATWPGFRTLRSQEIEVHTRRPRSISTDGEITTQTPATFRVVPQALFVLVSNTSDLSHRGDVGLS